MENTAKNKVAIKLVKGSDSMLSYDVQVLDQEASVQDYLDALNDFQEEKVGPCDGCSNCCWERVPLTAPDVLRYAAAFYGAEPEEAKAVVEKAVAETAAAVAKAEATNEAGAINNASDSADLADEYGNSSAAPGNSSGMLDDLSSIPGDLNGMEGRSSGDFAGTEDRSSSDPFLYFGNLRQKDTRQNLRFVREYAEIRGADFIKAAEAAAGARAKAEGEPAAASEMKAFVGAEAKAEAEPAAGAAVKAESAKAGAANTSAAAESPGLIDICLRRLDGGNCVFLDLDRQRCRVHTLRPLVCQSYVCLPSSRRAEALRRQIVNEGENELISILGDQVARDWRTYRSKGFEGKECFADVALRNVVNEGLWQRLMAEE